MKRKPFKELLFRKTKHLFSSQIVEKICFFRFLRPNEPMNKTLPIEVKEQNTAFDDPASHTCSVSVS